MERGGGAAQHACSKELEEKIMVRDEERRRSDSKTKRKGVAREVWRPPLPNNFSFVDFWEGD